MNRKLFVVLPLLAVVLVAAALLFTTSQIALSQSDDGRLNCDAAAPVVLYCSADGLDIYAPGGNDLLLRVPQAALDAAAPDEGYIELAASADGSVAAYLLSTGEIQVNALNGGELYTAQIWGCPAIAAWVKVYDLDTWGLLSSRYGGCDAPAEIVCWERYEIGKETYSPYAVVSCSSEHLTICKGPQVAGNNWYYTCFRDD